MTFYDRRDELEVLETAFDSAGHECYVVYGRLRGIVQISWFQQYA